MNQNFRLDQSKTEDFRLRNIAEYLIHRWYWFIVSVVAAIALSLLLIKITPASYKLSAVIMVDGRQKMGGMNSGTSTLLDPSIWPDNNNNAEKTVQVLKSTRLIRDVVRRLGLNHSYALKDG